MKPAKSLKKGWPIRTWVQLVFFAWIAVLAVGKGLGEAGVDIPFLPEVSLHAICPFGGVVTLYNLAALGRYVQKIHASAVVLMTLVFALAILLGPVFCGWVCPLGSIQEWIGKIGRKLLGKRYNRVLLPRTDRVLRYARYLVLVWVVYVTARSGSLIFSDFDPYYALFHFWTGEVAPTALVILGLTLAGSLLTERPWCKYACPYGALLGLFNKIRLFKVRRRPASCINCKLCDRACPMNISVSTDTNITDHQCISCYACTSENACPVPDTVVVETRAVKRPAESGQTGGSL